MNRIKAALIHFAISVVVFAIFLSLVYFIWYAYPFNLTQGIAEIVYLMAGIDIVLGPLLTLVVFNAAKKGLKMDLTIIGSVQVAALIYGAFIIYSERPAWIVFAVDRFEVVGINEVDASKLVDKSLNIGVFDKPRIVYAEIPTGEEANDILFAAIDGGADIDRHAQLYRQYVDNIDLIKPRMNDINAHSGVEKAVGENDKVKWFPVKGKNKNIVAIVDKETAEVENYLIIPPWIK